MRWRAGIGRVGSVDRAIRRRRRPVLIPHRTRYVPRPCEEPRVGCVVVKRDLIPLPIHPVVAPAIGLVGAAHDSAIKDPWAAARLTKLARVAAGAVVGAARGAGRRAVVWSTRVRQAAIDSAVADHKRPPAETILAQHIVQLGERPFTQGGGHRILVEHLGVDSHQQRRGGRVAERRPLLEEAQPAAGAHHWRLCARAPL